VTGILAVAMVLLGSAPPNLALRTLDSPDVRIEERRWWPPADQFVHAALLEASCAAAEVRDEESSLLLDIPEASEVHAIAARTEASECLDSDIDELWWMRTTYGEDARLDGALAFLLAETYRCLGDRSAAQAQYLEAVNLNPRLRGPVARRVDTGESYVVDPTLPLTISYGVLARWEILLERDGFERSSAFALVDLFDSADPTPWGADEIERLSWETDHEIRPERAVVRRFGRLGRFGARESADEKLEAVVRLVSAAPYREYFEDVGRLVIDLFRLPISAPTTLY